MRSILKNYRRRLLNLSASNKALLLLRLSKELHLDVQEIDFLNGLPAFSTIQSIITGKNRIAISPFADSRYTPVTPVSKRLRYIRRRADMIEEERGNQELYLGWPFVYGKFADGTVVRCPLLFFPVKLQVNARQEWELLQDSQQQPHFNQSFLLAYAHYTNTTVAEPLLELDWGSMSKDPLVFRTQVYELLKENQLALRVGSEFFADRLMTFRDLKKKELEDSTKPGELYLQPEAVVGIFPQAASYLLGDFDAMLEQEKLTDMESIFTSDSTDVLSPVSTQAQHSFTAFDLDASQEAVLQQVKQGKSVVVQGPPGTGKSQLICNLVSDFTARGKKVLVVSQKRAALDVVHQRLASKGLRPFAALVHDIHADRKPVFAQLSHQLEQLDTYKKQNLALNSIQTDRAFLETCRGINRYTEKLESFKSSLFDSSRCGWSPKELYLLSSLSEPHISLAGLYNYFTAPVVTTFLPKLRLYLERAQLFESDGFVWKQRCSFRDWSWQEKQRLEKIIQELPVQHNIIKEQFFSLTDCSFSIQELEKFEAAVDQINEIKELTANKGVTEAFLKVTSSKGSLNEIKKLVEILESMYLVCPAPDAAISDALLPSVNKAVVAYEATQESILKRVGWKFTKDRKILKQALPKYNLALDEQGVAKLKERLLLRKQATEVMQNINNSINYNLTLEDYPAAVLEKLTVLKQALEVHAKSQRLHRDKVIRFSLLTSAGLPQRLQSLVEAIDAARGVYNTWLDWLPAEQINHILEQPGFAQELIAALQEHFEAFVAHDSLYQSLTEQERSVISLLLEQSPVNAEAGEKLFMNSVYLSWLYDLETRSPILKSPSNGEINNLESEFQLLLNEKNKLSQEIVLSKLREQTYAEMEFNRLGNAITYRRLQVQVSKKRALYPIRKLFSQFRNEILKLVPCWLASPETVSAVFPLQECFDLVIFDEASQCFAEVGIPAVLRGRQIVVAGDSQQLKPFDLYRARWNPEDEEAEELIAESLLQLCGLYLPQFMLTQHYRSLYPELIEFSNRNFYRGILELIPYKENVNTKVPAVVFEKVQGLWKDNQNEPEAQKVVQLVRHFVESGQQDVGVITFNYKQQMLIQDMLEDNSHALPASILVKNIENMQGDEKDIIILSVGYAPDEKGKFAMQFGSLNQAGGENRLNVAITRARKKVIVVSSIEPEQLQVEAVLHPGPKLLKSYLQYAQQVSKGGFQFQFRTEPVPVHVSLLKTRLQQAIPVYQPVLPFADLTEVEENQYQSVLLTDDDLYYSHLSIRQSYSDLPQRLRGRNWPYKRIYSRQYWGDRSKVLASLKS